MSSAGFWKSPQCWRRDHKQASEILEITKVQLRTLFLSCFPSQSSERVLIDPDHMWLGGLFKPSDMSINYFNQRRRSVCVFWCFMPAACPFSYHLFMQIFIWNIYCVGNIFLHYMCLEPIGCDWRGNPESDPTVSVSPPNPTSQGKPVFLSFSNSVANREQGVGDKAA